VSRTEEQVLNCPYSRGNLFLLQVNDWFHTPCGQYVLEPYVELTLTDMVDNPGSNQPKRLRHMAPIPSCTEEKYIWIHDLGRGKAINKRVALIAGPRTTETTINKDDYPEYDAIDNGVFALTSDSGWSHGAPFPRTNQLPASGTN